jgi:hypothetical protein
MNIHIEDSIKSGEKDEEEIESYDDSDDETDIYQAMIIS